MEQKIEDKLNIKINFAGLGAFSEKSPLYYISEKIKKTFKNELNLREGLKLVFNEYRISKPKRVEFSISKSPIIFFYCLSGRFSINTDNKLSTNEIIFKKDMNAIIHFPDTNGEIIAYPDEEISILSFHLSPKFLSSLISNSEDFIDKFPFNNFEKDNLLFSDFDFMTLEMKNICHSIIENKKNKVINSIFIEAKVLELLSLHLEQLYNRNDNLIQNTNHENSLLVKEIKEYIIENIISPPSIIELSSKYSITHTKLNHIFKVETGFTVFEYLREYRLEYTKKLLEDGRANISEISFIAGWSSSSHLSREFKKKYGVNPKSIKINQ